MKNIFDVFSVRTQRTIDVVFLVLNSAFLPFYILCHIWFPAIVATLIIGLAGNKLIVGDYTEIEQEDGKSEQ